MRQVQFKTQVTTIRYFNNLDIFFITSLKGGNIVRLFLYLQTGFIEVIGDEFLNEAPVLILTNLKTFEVRFLQIFIQSGKQSCLNILAIDKLPDN